MGFTWSQQVALAITPKVTSVLSIAGSFWIVVEVLTQKQKRQNVYNRLLCAMSFFDIVNTFWFFASTWPIPKGTEGIAFPVGTEKSCTVQGFFLQFGIVPPLYNACLSVYYLLVVRYGISENTLVYVEPLFHLIPISFGLSTGVTGLALDLYNNANLWCWIAPLPVGCEDSRTYGETTCVRGDNAWIYRLAFYFGPLWFCILFVTLIMIFVYMSVKRREVQAIRSSESKLQAGHQRQSSFVLQGSHVRKRSSFVVGQAETAKRSSSIVLPKMIAERLRSSASIKFSGSGSTSERSAAQHVLATLETFTSAQHQNLEANQFGSRAVFRQSVLYTLAFYATFTFATLNRLLQQFTGKTFFAVIYLHSMFIPLQGFFNVMVYRYAYYFRLKYRNPHMTEWELIVNTWRWSMFGPPKGNRKSVLESAEDDKVPDTQRGAAANGRASEIGAQIERHLPSPREDADDEGSDTGSDLGDLRVGKLTDDVMGDPDDDQLYGMVSDLMVTYSDFPNILADDAVMVSTDFPNMAIDDFAFGPYAAVDEGPVTAPDAFPTAVPENNFTDRG